MYTLIIILRYWSVVRDSITVKNRKCLNSFQYLNNYLIVYFYHPLCTIY